MNKHCGTSTHSYDVIVIGSGISGLTVANLLAQVGKKRVVVLESHYQLGGYTHVFGRKGYVWDVGLHYVGRMARGLLPRVLFDFMSRGNIRWHRIADPYEAFIYPDFTFNVPAGKKAYQQRLEAMFPAQRRAIRRYFADAGFVSGWYVRFLLSDLLWSPVRHLFRMLCWKLYRLVRMTTADYLRENIDDERLRAVLVSQWGNYGLPPSQSSFVIHGLVVNHFMNGGYYPIGGAGVIARELGNVIRTQGGELRTRCAVREIMVNNGKATGVRATNSEGNDEVFTAPVIVSSAGAYNTFLKLLPPTVPLSFRSELRELPAGTCTVSLYLGLKEDPSRLGFRGENHWICDSYDHNRHFDDCGVLEGKPTSCYLSFPSLKDPESIRHTATVISYVDYERFRRWSGTAAGERGDEYYELKEVIADGLIAFVERRYPGFSALVGYRELATPLSTEHFTDHFEGAMYGLSAGTQRYRQSWLSSQTPLRGLYMTGTDIASSGVIGSMMGGVMTAARILGGVGLLRIVGSARWFSRSIGRQKQSLRCDAPANPARPEKGV